MDICPDCNGTGMIIFDADEDGYCATICWACAEDEDEPVEEAARGVQGGSKP
jgi:hypothetical protein